MTFQRAVLVFLITIVFSIVAFPQQTTETGAPDGTPEPKNAIKIDEFGKTNDEEIEARTDNLFTQLNNDPDAKGYIITYNGLDSMPSDYDTSPIRRRILKAIAFRRYDTSRLTFVDGGFREFISTEFFIVPRDGIPPKPTGTVPKPKMPKDKAFLWGRSVLGGWDDEEDPLNEFVLPDIKANKDAEMAEIKAEIFAYAASDDKDAAAEEQVTDDAEVEPELSTQEGDALFVGE